MRRILFSPRPLCLNTSQHGRGLSHKRVQIHQRCGYSGIAT